MDPINAFLLLAGIAWSGQTALGWLQIRRFNRALSGLADHGVVRIGRSSGRFVPRVVMAISVDSQNRVTGNFVMKGLTVFSSPVSEPKLAGLQLAKISPDIIFPHNKALRQALTLAITNKG
ncbi:MAG: transcriptional regulator GutM [Rouxiella aceris]|jgi:glucitol operon activator protein|uniref:Transcriptional regulator GutM n=1 Tax=Rouxiella aceris TaxID=2703884 RepID=A0A848MR71_9GAMM|nr:transcriptional regulator GutM [Rouxiella aceris]MDR3434135.1 transcriptional regulator GutM [Rouxiella aceris]NMP29352.1 transcriptional regulator GutM [Rouxiella aceris]